MNSKMAYSDSVITALGKITHLKNKNHHQSIKSLALRDNSRSGTTTWGLVRNPGGRSAATACSVMAKRDHRLTASRNG